MLTQSMSTYGENLKMMACFLHVQIDMALFLLLEKSKNQKITTTKKNRKILKNAISIFAMKISLNHLKIWITY